MPDSLLNVTDAELTARLTQTEDAFVERNGATTGIDIPTRPRSSQADLEALRVAGEKMQELIAAAGTTEDEIVADFKQLRRARRIQKS